MAGTSKDKHTILKARFTQRGTRAVQVIAGRRSNLGLAQSFKSSAPMVVVMVVVVVIVVVVCVIVSIVGKWARVS